jgi:hypothetical protein
MTYFDYSGSSPTKTLIRRQRTLPNAGSRTLHFIAPNLGRKSPVFLRPEDVPEFDGEEAIFEYKPAGRGRITLLRLVEVTKR